MTNGPETASPRVVDVSQPGRTWGEIRFVPADDLKTPDICPACSAPADAKANVLQYVFEDASTGEMMAFGLVGQLLKSVAFGMSGKKLITVNLCRRCRTNWLIYKVLEYVARLGGIAMVFVFLTWFSTPQRPLIRRSWEWWVLTASPLLAGGVLGHVFRRFADACKGIVCAADKQGLLFRVRSGDWRNKFIAENP